MTGRRSFVKKLGTMGAAAGFLSWVDPLNILEENRLLNLIRAFPETESDDAEFWSWVRQSYSLNWSMINMNNGGVSPQPLVVESAFHAYNRLANQGPSYYMWRILDMGREALRTELAVELGCETDELAICRNTTEAMATAIFGLELMKGDEVVLNKYDYPNVKSAFSLLEKRLGIVIRWVDMDFPAENDDAIVESYLSMMNSKTKVVVLTHMINWVGQIIPVRKIADAAKDRGLTVIVDAAHTFAHVDFKVRDLNCDFLGTSLHKWLCAPYGTGLLYVNKSKIKNHWPLLPDHDPVRDDIRKFENLGTRSFPAEQAIAQALEFHRSVGITRKEKRLRFLKDKLYDSIVDIKGIRIKTSRKEDYSGALLLAELEQFSGSEISSKLQKEHNIHTTAIEFGSLNGVRITPHIYTSLHEIEKVSEALRSIAKVGK